MEYNKKTKTLYGISFYILMILITLGALSKECMIVTGDLHTKFISVIYISFAVVPMIAHIYMKAKNENAVFIKIVPKTKNSKLNIFLYLLFSLIYVAIITLLIVLLNLLLGLISMSLGFIEYAPKLIVIFFPFIGNCTFSSINFFSLIMSGEYIKYIIIYSGVIFIFTINILISYFIYRNRKKEYEKNYSKLFYLTSSLYVSFTFISIISSFFVEEKFASYLVISNYFLYIIILEIIVLIFSLILKKKYK